MKRCCIVLNMSDGTIDEIKARLNIVEFVGSYVKLEKAGTHWKACCPFHQERTPSFMVNDEKNLWHCFGCGKGGDVFAFVMEMEGLEFREALKMLAERAGVELPSYKGKNQEQNQDAKDRLYALLELAAKFYEKQIWEGQGKEKILPYLRERGLSEESIIKFRLGYAPDGWRHVLEFLTSKGFTFQEIENAGLVIKKSKESFYDRFRDRIMFPIFDILGRVIGYSARVAPGGDETQAKYVNTPETLVYHKSRALYGLFQAKQSMKQVGETVVVEGNMDVIAMHQAGLSNTIAISGTAFTPEQLSIIKRYGKKVVLFFDMDDAGRKAARKSAELILEQELVVSVVALLFGKDASDINKENPKKLHEAVARSTPALRHFLNESLKKYNRSTSDGKRGIVDEYAELMLFIKNPIEKSHWIKELAREIQTEEKIVASAVNSAIGARERRERYSVSESGEQNDAQKSVFFNKRSELLREEIIGLMCANGVVRKTLFHILTNDGETKAFLEKHPLYFFLFQAGEDDPLPLIEDPVLKNKATRMIFKALEAPDFIGVSAEDLTDKMLEISKKYVSDLKMEVTKREKLLALELAIKEAREKQDKELEKNLMSQFTKISLDKP